MLPPFLQFLAYSLLSQALECPPGTTQVTQGEPVQRSYCVSGAGVAYGPHVVYLRPEIPLLAGNYEDGARHGVFEFFCENGKTWYLETWVAGLLVSHEMVEPAMAQEDCRPSLGTCGGVTLSSSIEEPAIDSQIVFEAPRRPCKTGDTKLAFPRSDTSPAFLRCYDAVGMRTGIWQILDDEGSPASEIQYEEGQLDGLWRLVGPGGETQLKQYVRGKLWRYPKKNAIDPNPTVGPPQ